MHCNLCIVKIKKWFLSITISIKSLNNYYDRRWKLSQIRATIDGASKCLCLAIWKFPSRRPKYFTTL